jgi:hypothetical protein
VTASAILSWLTAPPDGTAAHAARDKEIFQHDVKRVRAVRAWLKDLDNAHGGGVAFPMAAAYLRGEVATLLRDSYDEATWTGRPGGRHSPGVLRQWWLLTRRNADVLVRNRLTLAILLGSPVLVTAMMSMLFQPGAFERRGAADVSPAQIVFWVAFAGFFFGTVAYRWLVLAGLAMVFTLTTVQVLRRRCLPRAHGRR